jgi:WD40 repeat protein
VASGGFDGSVRLWDAATGAALLQLQVPGCKVNSVAFAPDGKTLAAAVNKRAGVPADKIGGGHEDIAGRGEIHLWDASSGAERAVLTGLRGMALSVAFTPDGRTLASGGGDWDQFGEVALWDAATGRCRFVLQGHASWVEGVAFSPDSRTLVTVGGAGSLGELKLWDLTGRAAAGPVQLTPAALPGSGPSPRPPTNTGRPAS